MSGMGVRKHDNQPQLCYLRCYDYNKPTHWKEAELLLSGLGKDFNQ